LTQHLPLTIAFCVIVGFFLVLDLGFLSRKAQVVSFKESLLWSAFWICLALAFGGGVYWRMGSSHAVTFVTSYLVELSLSIDNLFVFLLIFTSFKIPAESQRRVLIWGIIGAMVMRAVCIAAGVVALARFSWLVYVFGAILIVAGIKTGLASEEDAGEEGVVIRMVKRLVPVTPNFHGQSFVVGEGLRRKATPLLLALIVVEISDVIFAIDSIPAVLAITTDPFIVYTSNIFAILGLRSIYFALAHMLGAFRYLKYALSVILVFVGVKIALSHFIEIPVVMTLGIVVGLLALSIFASLIIKEKPPQGSPDPK